MRSLSLGTKLALATAIAFSVVLGLFTLGTMSFSSRTVERAVGAVREIAERTAVIEELAHQTNLLALNAAIATENAQASEEIAATAEGLAREAEALRRELEYFRIGRAGGPGPARLSAAARPAEPPRATA